MICLFHLWHHACLPYAVAFHSPLILSPPATIPQTPIKPIFHPGTPPVTPLKCSAMGNHADAIAASIHHLRSTLSSSSLTPTSLFSTELLAALFVFRFCASLASLKKSQLTPASQNRYAVVYSLPVVGSLRFSLAITAGGTTPWSANTQRFSRTWYTK